MGETLYYMYLHDIINLNETERERQLMKVLTYMAIGLAIILWSLSFPLLDFLLEHMTVMELNVIRFIMVTFILWPIQWVRPKKMTFASGDFLLIFITGIFGTASYSWLVTLGLTSLSPSMVGLATGAIPVTTLILALLFFQKKTPFRNMFLVFLSFMGVIIIMSPWQQGQLIQGVGIWQVLLANVFWAFYILLNRQFCQKYDKLQLLTVQFSAGTAMVLVYYLYVLSGNPEIRLMNISEVLERSDVLATMLAVVLLVSIVGYLLFNHIVVEAGAIMSVLGINVIPVVMLMIGVSLGLEMLTFNKVVGSVLVVTAMFFIDDIG